MTLAAWQKRAASEISAPQPSWSDDLLAAVVPGGTLDAAGALAVYRSGYFARLTEQLGETYATIWRVLGDDGFFALAARCIAETKSSSYNLSDYGAAFPVWLESQPEAREVGFLAELARFEWAFHEAFHEPPHVAMAAADIAAIGDLTGVVLELGPSVRVVETERAVYELFRRRHDDEAPDVDIDRPQRVLLFKQEGELLAREIDAGQARVIAALAGGEPVDEAIDAAAGADPAFGAPDVARVFELLGRCGLVAGFSRR